MPGFFYFAKNDKFRHDNHKNDKKSTLLATKASKTTK
jgi:hypothetical protein